MKLEPAQAKTEAGIMASDERNANEKENCRIYMKIKLYLLVKSLPG